MKVVAHRGLRHEAPENTRAAILAALALEDLHGVEFDVELTLDQKLVVVHQETVVPDSDFQALIPATRDYTARDWVGENPFDRILSLDAGNWFDSRCAGERVPSLSEILDLPWGDRVAYVELKDATYWGKRDLTRPERIVRAAIPVLANFRGTLDIISFNPEVLRLVGQTGVGCRKTLALWTEWIGRIDKAIESATDCSATTLLLPDYVVIDDPRWVEQLAKREIRLFVYPVSPALGEKEFSSWTPESQHERWAALLRLGVEGVFTDFAREAIQFYRDEVAYLKDKPRAE